MEDVRDILDWSIHDDGVHRGTSEREDEVQGQGIGGDKGRI